jgi:hypothetical protein
MEALSHMLRHACGYQLANDGQDARAIQHTVRYTDLSAHRFKESWKAMLRYAFHASSQDGIFGGLGLQPQEALAPFRSRSPLMPVMGQLAALARPPRAARSWAAHRARPP